MNIKRYELGQLQANCYLITVDRDCILIDPGDDANFLLEEISRQNLNLIACLATHGHFDHVMAAGEIQLSIPAPLHIHRKDMFLIKRLNETARYFLGFEPHIIKPSIIKEIEDGDRGLNHFPYRVMHTPGHTPGCVCYYFPEEQVLFTGDTLFEGAIGRTDLSYSSKADLRSSLSALFKLPESTIVYPGHGGETSLLSEKE